MSSFLIKKNDKEKVAIEIKLKKEGYGFHPNVKFKNGEINKITIFNSSMIDVILAKKIEKQFKRIAAIVYDILSSDDEDSSADAIIALDEVSRLREIILNKYQKFLEKETEKMYIKKLRILENELRSKIVLINTYAEEMEEIKGRGR